MLTVALIAVATVAAIALAWTLTACPPCGRPRLCHDPRCPWESP